MNKKLFLAIAGMLSFAFADINQVAIHATQAVQQRLSHSHWSYSGETGPSHWGELKDEYFMCKEGKNQSPVNLNRFANADLQKLKITYAGNAVNIIDNGHTLKIETNIGNKIVVDGITFTLKQFHFHTPSENMINGKRYPMEAHFVHSDKDGNLAVIAVMFKEGEENMGIKKIIEQLPKEKNKKVGLIQMFNPGELFPRKLEYYRYSGSLTTPPCSEGVRWIVIKTPAEASKEQIEAIRKIVGKNNRPIQPLNARVILR